MNQRCWMALCGLSCALIMMSGQSLAGSNLAPVPLAPSQATLATWAHVISYTGSFSGDIENSSAGGWHEHFAGTLVLAQMCPNCRTQSFIPVFHGDVMTTQSASGNCGSANTSEHTQVVLSMNLASHTYDLHFNPNPGSVELKGGDPKCTQPFQSVFPLASFSIAMAPLPAPAAGICGTKTFYRSAAATNETDTFHWTFSPKSDQHWTITMYCPSTIDGVAPLH
jgi:hypothetical protein